MVNKRLTVAELIDTINTNRLQIAATMAAIWWAKKLSAQYADKRLVFAKALEKCILWQLETDGYYGRGGLRYESGKGHTPVFISCDYYPQYCLVPALIEAIPGWQDKNYYDILPRQHCLSVNSTSIYEIFEGYDKPVNDISVPVETDIEQLYLELKQS